MHRRRHSLVTACPSGLRRLHPAQYSRTREAHRLRHGARASVCLDDVDNLEPNHRLSYGRWGGRPPQCKISVSRSAAVSFRQGAHAAPTRRDLGGDCWVTGGPTAMGLLTRHNNQKGTKSWTWRFSREWKHQN